MKRMLFVLIALVFLNGCIIRLDAPKNRDDSLRIAKQQTLKLEYS